MSKEKLIPELRFPEFKEGKEWVVKKLGLLTNTTIGEFVIKTKQDPNSPYPVYNGGKSYTGFYDEYNNEANKIVISARGANAGFVNLVKQKYWAGNSCYSVEVIEQNKIDLELLFYYIKHNQKRFTDNQQAANIPSVSKGDVEKFQICYPDDILEQQKIASCLSSLDEVIAANNQKLELLKDHKKGLMQNLFPQEGEKVPKVRFKEFEKDGEWLQTTVENNCEIKGRIGYRGYTTQDIVGQGEGALVLGGKHIQNQLLELKDPTYLSWDKYYESPEIMVEVGHIIFSQRGTLGDCAIIDREIGPATINPSMVLIKNITCDARFLYYILIGDCIQEEVRKNRSKGAIPMLSQKQIKEFSFLIPKPKEQQKIASCLSSLDALITAQVEKIEQLQLHKKGLMQGLFPTVSDR